ncbi:MAG: metal ABC transporter substrate-binding protein [Bacilli bacterium]|jgi:zinc transport system substrate-binding protein
MKRISLILIVLSLIISLSGCFKKDLMEGIKVYTTIYPIEYITKYLYEEHALIYTIYPNDVDVFNYQLTDKQLTDFSLGDLFIYNGLSKERDYAIEMLNKNRNLKIIDAAMNMEYSYGIEEVWIDPSNFLMLAQNIKTGFEQYIVNPYLKNEINNNYEGLKIKLSELDAELNLVSKNAKDKYLVVSDNIWLFLEKYDFNIISLEEEDLTPRKIADVKKLAETKQISYIFTKGEKNLNKTITDLVKEYELTIEPLRTATNLTEEDRLERRDFVDLMKENIDLIKKELYENRQ